MESNASGLLQQLVEMQKHQAVDLQSLESFVISLKERHQRWQKSMDALLESEQIRWPTKPSPRMEVPRGDLHVDVPALTDVCSDDEVLDGELPQRGLSRPTRAGTLEELFRSRKSVAQAPEPSGLKRMVEEEIMDKLRTSETENAKTRMQKCRALASRVVRSNWFEQLGRKCGRSHSRESFASKVSQRLCNLGQPCHHWNRGGGLIATRSLHVETFACSVQALSSVQNPGLSQWNASSWWCTVLRRVCACWPMDGSVSEMHGSLWMPPGCQFIWYVLVPLAAVS